jgi:hypothetical protein
MCEILKRKFPCQFSDDMKKFLYLNVTMVKAEVLLRTSVNNLDPSEIEYFLRNVLLDMRLISGNLLFTQHI